MKTAPKFGSVSEIFFTPQVVDISGVLWEESTGIQPWKLRDPLLGGTRLHSCKGFCGSNSYINGCCEKEFSGN